MPRLHNGKEHEQQLVHQGMSTKAPHDHLFLCRGDEACTYNIIESCSRYLYPPQPCKECGDLEEVPA